MRYSIEDTTLRGIADAVRRKHGETKIITVTESRDYKISKTKNALGFDTSEGQHETQSFIDTVTIEGATGILVKIGYQTTSKTYARVQVASGTYTMDDFPTDAERYGGASKEYVELSFENTDTVTFLFTNNGAANISYLGYYAEVYGTDAEGNLLTDLYEAEVDKEVPNMFSSAEMADAIDSLDTISPEAYLITGNCNYMFNNGKWDWFLETHKDKVTTENLIDTSYMFYASKITSMPFEINFREEGYNCSFMFGMTKELDVIPSIDFKQTKTYRNTDSLFIGSGVKEIGTIKNLYPEKMNIFKDCKNLRYLPEFENLNLDRIYTYQYAGFGNTFSGCNSLRMIPEDLLKRFYQPVSTSGSYCVWYYGFTNCNSLDEIRGLNPHTGTMTSNSFANSFANCNRLKNIIFATQEDGTPYVCNWKSQTIDLTGEIGYEKFLLTATPPIVLLNSGITEDKRVTDDVSYQALKDDPDWFSTVIEYSRYNHDSAVNTINSLPDTSAYLASAGGTNTIKFNGESGSLTDGGAINTLTEEEIAVATAKGWTVTLV